MKKIFFFLSIVGTLLACQNLSSSREPASDKSAKKIKSQLKNLTAEARLKYISQARATNKNYDPQQVANFDVIQSLEERCGSLFHYQKTNKSTWQASQNRNKDFEVYQWPRLECTYHPDDGSLSGATAKFLCDFDRVDGQVETLKVKYAKQLRQEGNSEVLATILATNMAVLAGFYADAYCPAEIVCKNCPSEDPWNQQKASASAGSGSQVFRWAVVERQLPAQTITVPGPHPVPPGVDWSEIKTVQSTDASSFTEEKMRIEREAWMLWINWIMDTDAARHNQRISCLNAELNSQGEVLCKESILYTHDYGQAFMKNFRFSSWVKEPVFANSPAGCQGRLRASLREANSPLKGLILEPFFSSEARDLLASRLARVRDEQWMTIFQLSRAEEFIGTDSGAWLKAIKRKISELGAGSCRPLASQSSVLTRP